jgi:hypothetical protein
MIIIISLFFIIYILSSFVSKEEKSISKTLFASGITLIMSGIPEVVDQFLKIIASLLNVNLSDDVEGNYQFRVIIGFILIGLSIFSKFVLKERIYVLNMYGIAAQKDIDEIKALEDLKLAEYKVKEQVIDFVQFFDGTTINSKSNKAICAHIENSAKKFCAKVTEQNKCCFTGMAPIPYTVFAGTFVESAKINRYFEYNNRDGGNYYEIKKGNKKQHNSSPELKLLFPSAPNSDLTEVVLAISISHKVRNEDLSQFSTDIVHLDLDNPQDNVIKYSQQLNDYKNIIYNCIETDLINKYPNLKTIHIAASIPSCMSLEIGKSIGMRTNRVQEVVVHHYISSHTPPYVFGLYVNGSKKGQLYHL